MSISMAVATIQSVFHKACDTSMHWEGGANDWYQPNVKEKKVEAVLLKHTK